MHGPAQVGRRDGFHRLAGRCRVHLSDGRLGIELDIEADVANRLDLVRLPGADDAEAFAIEHLHPAIIDEAQTEFSLDDADLAPSAAFGLVHATQARRHRNLVEGCRPLVRAQFGGDAGLSHGDTPSASYSQ